jgi:hypothetical protein
MITICWAAKGGSGTTVIAASRALATTEPTLLVDLDGDLPATIGLPEPEGPGVHDWLGSDAAPDRLDALEVAVDATHRILPVGHSAPPRGARWAALAEHLARDRRQIIVDAGTKAPPAELLVAADQSWLVTRACYLSLRAAVLQGCRPTGIVLVDEPGRSLRAADIEAALGAPVVATVLVDPAVARAVDAGLLVARLPGGLRRQLRRAA